MDKSLDLALIRFIYDRTGLPERDQPFEYMTQMFEDLRGASNEANQTEYVTAALKTFGGEDGLETKRIRRYDRNIKSDLDTINEARDDSLTLRYYQYIAVFFAEYYLDLLSEDEDELKRTFNTFIRDEFVSIDRNPLSITDTSELHSLAYWMATGSGKTYIAHLNYYQFKRHIGADSVDNIILIAPKEQIARQHVDEFTENGINAARINSNTDADVLVTDFDKLDRDESGPKTVDVEEYRGDNLVFVDEGHKGLGSMGQNLSTGWKALRDELIGDNGYSIEYSATYGSAIKDEEGYQEYAKAILFDYPYGRFHKDGYGKDYKILNIEATADERDTDHWDEQRLNWLLLNTLAYYEKVRIFEEHPNEAAEYNIKKPLSVFVGGRVNKPRRGDSATDVQRLIEFFQRLLTDTDWATSVIQDTIASEIEFEHELDAFDEAFDYLRYETNSTPDALYEDLCQRLFDTTGQTTLEVHRLPNDDGEIGLTTPDSPGYFGVITIGKDKDFTDMIAAQEYRNVRVREIETFSDLLFERISNDDSQIRFLIGSKKFSEGWDSVRPTNMGFLNLGRSKGPATIQMFGRGVRLNGKHNDGKRERFADSHISAVETLHVFGLRSSYIEEFRDSLADERVDTNTTDVHVNVEITDAGEEHDTYYRPTTSTEVEDLPVTTLADRLSTHTDTPTVTLGIGIEEIQSTREAVETKTTTSRHTPVSITDSLQYRGEDVALSLLDWDSIHDEVLRYKRQEDIQTVIVEKETVKQLITEDKYTLYADEQRLNLESLSEKRDIENICATIVQKWLLTVHQGLLSDHETETISLAEADSEWFDTVVPDSFRLRIEKNGIGEEIIGDIKNLDSLDDLEDTSRATELLLNLARHYYKPIAISSENADVSAAKYLDRVHPEGLNKGERIFIKSVNSFFSDIPDEFDRIENAVALRNPSNTGIGFQSAGGFYPDFVIWMDTDEKQYIIFADPKGLMNVTQDTKQKIEFCGSGVQVLSDEVDDGVELQSYIVGRLDRTRSGNERSASDIIEKWSGTLESMGYEGEGRELLNSANVYLQDETGQNTIEDIISDILKNEGAH
jgi:hypothetical protein